MQSDNACACFVRVGRRRFNSILGSILESFGLLLGAFWDLLGSFRPPGRTQGPFLAPKSGFKIRFRKTWILGTTMAKSGGRGQYPYRSFLILSCPVSSDTAGRTQGAAPDPKGFAPCRRPPALDTGAPLCCRGAALCCTGAALCCTGVTLCYKWAAL